LGCLFVQAKAAHKEELTSSLQKLRGKDFNISHEISDIQVWNSSSRLQTQLFVKVVLVSCSLMTCKLLWNFFGIFLVSD
jgi:hypothetical protein